ncbi:expressed unknown protein [Seminavis robusta]|uniref:Uncharacterized protein n=1 Tax=Seminavis robusta TaxID=568900 RepID=A0A9N8DVP7_9STRA|nr:expressed unknown protein [Seminavis robusta]|eukprot:Sro310_g114160.1 n/a (664) ;mRNA; f:76045-78036
MTWQMQPPKQVMKVSMIVAFAVLSTLTTFSQLKGYSLRTYYHATDQPRKANLRRSPYLDRNIKNSSDAIGARKPIMQSPTPMVIKTEAGAGTAKESKDTPPWSESREAADVKLQHQLAQFMKQQVLQRQNTTQGTSQVSVAAGTSTKERLQEQEDNQVFVCITGVLGDLELENKIENLLRPLSNSTANDSLHIAMVLQDDSINTATLTKEAPYDSDFMAFREPYSFYKEALYGGGRLITNHSQLADQYDLFSRFQGKEQLLNLTLQARPNRSFRSKYDILGYLRRQMPRLRRNKIIIDIQPPLVNPPVNLEYVRAIAISGTFEDGEIRRDNFERTIWRAVNDVRLLNQYKQCGEFLGRLANDTNTNNRVIVVRAGEDAILAKPLNAALLATTHIKNYHLPCTTKRGHGVDQIDVMSLPDAGMAREYLERPIKEFYQEGTFGLQSDQGQTEIRSLPQFLQHVYSKIVMREPPNSSLFPVPYPLADDSKALEPRERQLEPAARRAFVCITGQVGRLEMANKLRTIIKPLLESGFYDHVDVAMVLGDGNATYNKAPTDDASAVFNDIINGTSFRNKRDVVKWFHHHHHQNISWVNRQSTYTPNPNQAANPQYVIQMGRNGIFIPQKDYTTMKLEQFDRKYAWMRRKLTIACFCAPLISLSFHLADV